MASWKTIILLFGQQTEPSRSLSRSRNPHVNRRKIEKIENGITHYCHFDPGKLLSLHVANKRSLDVRSEGLEIPMLIGEK